MSGDTEWLASLKTGDEVALRRALGFRGEAVSIVKVTHTTKTQVVIGNIRFRRANGATLGSGYHHDYIVPPSPGLRARAIRQDRLLRIEQFKFRELTDSQVARIAEIISEPKGET